MPRFVILEHDRPSRHWDLLLEAGDVLRTWRLLSEPVPGTAVPAEASFDHRLLYLDYEGPISDGRGTVRRWDTGEYAGDLTESAGRMRLTLRGQRLQGEGVLERLGEGTWVFRVE